LRASFFAPKRCFNASLISYRRTNSSAESPTEPHRLAASLIRFRRLRVSRRVEGNLVLPCGDPAAYPLRRIRLRPSSALPASPVSSELDTEQGRSPDRSHSRFVSDRRQPPELELTMREYLRRAKVAFDPRRQRIGQRGICVVHISEDGGFPPTSSTRSSAATRRTRCRRSSRRSGA
jgi:hypothetical protein